MTDPRLRPRRSALYVPGSNVRAIDKARSLDADVMIFDLEDAVAPDKKDEARANVAAALKQGGYRAERVIRVNHHSTRDGVADIKMAARAGCDAVLLPMVESAKDVRDASLRLGAAGASDMKLWSMIETPLAVLRVEEVAFSSPHLACLVMGTSDLTKDLRARHTHDRLPVITSLSLCLLAARAAGLVILDGVHLDLDDEPGFLASCRQGAEMGFDGRTLIHPKTIAGANTAYGPSADDVAWSKRIIEAHNQALAQGKGVVVVDGKLIENVHVEVAERTLALAAAIDRR
jgi:citrate lyase subunit beta/citryl-CoA lyase